MLTITRVDKSYEVEAGESRQSFGHRVGVSTLISHNIFDQVVSSIGSSGSTIGSDGKTIGSDGLRIGGIQEYFKN
jgi:hypothetical protein